MDGIWDLEDSPRGKRDEAVQVDRRVVEDMLRTYEVAMRSSHVHV